MALALASGPISISYVDLYSAITQSPYGFGNDLEGPRLGLESCIDNFFWHYPETHVR